MTEILFYLFAALSLGSAAMAISRKNAVSSACWLVLMFFGLAGAFVLMEAYFVAAVQVLVYAGAIMVLFLFVIMLLNLRDADLRVVQGPRLHFAGAVVGGLFLMGLVWTCRRAGPFDVALEAAGPIGETRSVAAPLFHDYALPFEIVAFLLLAAIIGAIYLARRPEEDDRAN